LDGKAAHYLEERVLEGKIPSKEESIEGSRCKIV
jgi:hypothetical protein